MIVHEIFAQILDDEIKNIIVCDNYELANFLARATYGESAFAVDCLQYQCVIGGKYRNGNFYNVNEDGTETILDRIPTPEEEVGIIKEDNTELTLAMADILGGVYNA